MKSKQAPKTLIYCLGHLEYEFTHLSHFEGTFLETVEVVICQNKEPLLPP